MTKNEKRAETLVNKIMLDTWQPTTVDITRYFNISEQTVKQVKKLARKLAIDRSVLFGFDPDFNHFRVVHQVDKKAVLRILKYYVAHWRDAGQATEMAYYAAYNMGVIGKELYDRVALQYDSEQSPLNEIEKTTI